MSSMEEIESSFTEVSCNQRSVKGEQFQQGGQDFAFSVSQPNVWYPSRSYFRVTLELYGPGNALVAPTIPDQIAFAEQCVSNAYLNAYIYGGGSLISSVVDIFPQIAAVAARTATSRSAAWQKTTGSVLQTNGTFSQRCAAVSTTRTGALTASLGMSGVEPETEEFYRPVALNGKATLEVQAAAAPALPVANDITDTTITVPTDFGDVKVEVDAGLDVMTGKINTLNTALKARDDAAAARSLQRTIVSGTTAAATSTAFALGTIDAGVVIHIGTDQYTIVSVAVDGAGIQTLTATGGAGPAVAATSQWHAVRRNLTRRDQARNIIQVMWTPPLGLFQSAQPMRAGSYRFVLSPNPNYKFTMVETSDPAYALLGVDSRYTVVVNDVKLYLATGKLDIGDGISELDITEFAGTSKIVQGTSTNLQWTVPQSTETLFVAFQDPAAGSTPRCPPNRLIDLTGSDLNLKSIQLTYANQTKVQTNWESGFVSNGLLGKIDKLRQLYYMSLQESERAMEAGGAESFNTWLSRGPIYAFTFKRSENARDTEVNMRLTFENPDGSPFNEGMKVFLISEHRRILEITHFNGQAVGVVSRNT